MLTIDWIRHTSLQISGELCYGQTDVRVADSFPHEAEVVKTLLQHHKYDAIYTSPLSRALKLCEHCGFSSIAIPDERVMERSFGAWELKTWAEIEELLQTHPDRHTFVDHTGHIVPPNGETMDDLLLRVKSFITDLRMMRYRRVAVFCHGGVVNTARYLHGAIDMERIFTHVPDYGSITTLEYTHLDSRICVE